MSSSDFSEGRRTLDLERGLPVSAEDNGAQRRAARSGRSLSVSEYLALLESWPVTSREELARRPSPAGEPFSLA